jgi:hypothetical protein
MADFSPTDGKCNFQQIEIIFKCVIKELTMTNPKGDADIVNVREAVIVVGIDRFFEREIRLQLEQSNFLQEHFTRFRGKSIEVQCRIANKCKCKKTYCNEWRHYNNEMGVTRVRLSNNTRKALLKLLDRQKNIGQVDINGRIIRARTGIKSTGHGSDLGNFGRVTEWD